MAYDPADSYEDSIDRDTEPELFLPEVTEKEIDQKSKAEAAKERRLREAADYDIPPPGKNEPMDMIVPIKGPGGPRTEHMPESRFDAKLRAKADRLSRDQQRLQKRKEQFNAYVKDINKQAQINSFADGYFISRSALRSAEEYLRKNRRGKKAGRSGKTGSYTSRARSKT